MSEPVAERQLELAGGNHVTVRLCRPEQDDAVYRCDYTITWPDRERRFHGFGEDSLQALFIAMQMAHADLLASPEGRAGKLLWFDQPDLGLPEASAAATRQTQLKQPGQPECSFCGKYQTEVLQLVAGADSFICNECIQLGVDVVAARHPDWLETHRQFVEQLGRKG
jgi:hypothetical protein